MHSSITTFFAAWGEADDTARADMLQGCLSAAALAYTDPRMAEPITDPKSLTDYIAMFSQNAPGWIARPTETTQDGDTHKVSVSFEGPDGTAQMGLYEIQIDADGSLTRIHGVKA